MITQQVHRYSPLDSGALCRLFREDISFLSGQNNANPQYIMGFIDHCLASPAMFFMGRDPRWEVFIFAPLHNMHTYSCHIAIREDRRKMGGISEAAAQAAKIIMEGTDCRTFMAFIPDSRRLAQIVAAQIGFRRCGKTTKSFFFGQQAEGEVIYEATVDDYNMKWGDKLGRI